MPRGVEQFGKYLLLEQVASGGMAEVFLAKLQSTGGINKFVAIKKILPQFADHQEFIQMFKEEAKVAINLRHANVVSIYEFGAEKGQLYLVMEFVEGRNLRQVLHDMKKAGKQFSIEQILYMIKEAAAGLDYAHRCIDSSTGKPLNIVHRDMSPQNIMVSFEGEVKIIDFGIAKAETQMESTQAGTLKGKFGYMSPEQAEGYPVDSQSDIFSLGIVLWELLANDRLFTANNEGAILRKVRECNIPSIRKLNPLVPAELEKIVMKALAKEKSIRYETAEALNRDVSRFMNMNYPDFSPKDFSVFLKDTFSVLFTDIKKKQVDFSNIVPMIEQQPNSPFSPPSALPDIKNMDDPFEDSQAEFFNNMGAKADPNSKVSLDVKTSHGNGTMKSKIARDQAFKSQMTQTSAPAGFNHTGIGSKTSLGRGTNVSSQRFSKPSFFEEHGQTLMYLACAGLVVMGTVIYLGNNSPTEVIQKPPQIAKKEEQPVQQPAQLDPKTVTELEQASAQMYEVNLSSDPQGASIIIDGVDTGEKTPILKKMKANTPFTLRLAREGYADSTTTVKPNTEAFRVMPKLEKLKYTAMLQISIINGGSNPVLKVDGITVELTSTSQRTLTVAAGTEHTIESFNPITGLKASGKISIPPSQKANISLILK